MGNWGWGVRGGGLPGVHAKQNDTMTATRLVPSRILITRGNLRAELSVNLCVAAPSVLQGLCMSVV